jgi:hypothetical protein
MNVAGSTTIGSLVSPGEQTQVIESGIFVMQPGECCLPGASFPGWEQVS